MASVVAFIVSSIRFTSGCWMIGAVFAPCTPTGLPCSLSRDHASARWYARSATATPSRPTERRAAFIMMNAARLSVGLEGVAVAERAYQRALAWSRERLQGKPVGVQGAKTAPIIQHPDVKRMLLTMKATTEAMRALAYWTSAMLDRARKHPDENERRRAQALVDFLIPIVKGWSTEMGIEIASLGVQVHGGMGFIEETGAAQHLRDARITTIYEGTTGIQANDLVGRKLLREGGRSMHALIAQIDALGETLAGAAAPDLRAIGARLRDGARAMAD